MLRHPSRFQDHHVTVTGLAEVNGAEIALWRDPAARRGTDLKKLIIVLQRQDEIEHALRGDGIAPHSGANLHWVKVTGIVDTNLHGRFGSESFQLLLEKLQVLPGLRLREFLPVVGFFRNDSSQEVRFKLYNAHGDIYAETGAGPHDVTQIGVQKGTVMVTTLSGKKLATCFTVDHRYFDGARKGYYFRFASGKIEPVLPPDARAWNLGYLGDRD